MITTRGGCLYNSAGAMKMLGLATKENLDERRPYNGVRYRG